MGKEPELMTEFLIQFKKDEKKQKIKPSKKVKKEKIDHTYLFGKWKDFDIDPKKL